jgi:uncharacterized protein (DUF58 family)
MSGPHRLAASLTPRGWGLATVVVLLAVGAEVVGIAELYPVAAAALVVLLYALAWAWTRSWSIDVGRRLQPSRIEAGAASLVVITLQNRAATFSPVLTLRDPMDGGGRTTQLQVAPLAPGQRLAGTYELRPSGRGVITLGPLSLEATDPLGLARRLRSSTVVSTLVVQPRVEHLRPPRVGAGTDGGRRAGAPLTGRVSDEFSSLRAYEEGDDIRRMHWASTARTNTLMVREDQRERLGQLTVILDARKDSWSAGMFEQAVAATASIVSAGLDGGRYTRVLTTDGTDSGAGASRAHRSQILDMLARVDIHDDRPRTTVGRGRSLGAAPKPASGTVVVVSSDDADIDDLCRTAGMGRGGDVIAVIIERSARSSAGADVAAPRGQSPRRTSGAGRRVVRVAGGAALGPVWDPIA